MAPKAKKAAAKPAAPKKGAAKEKPKKASIPSEPEVKGLPLKLSILGARNMPVMDEDGTDTYCEFEYRDEKYRTDTIRESLQPNWNQTFEMVFEPEQQEKKIKLKLWDQDAQGDDFIGHGFVDLEELKIGTAIICWPTLAGNKRSAGNVGYKVCIGEEVECEQRDEEPEEFIEGMYDEFEGVGNLVVTIVEARNITALDSNNTSDPYVTFDWRGKPVRTSTNVSTLNPVWDETFHVDYENEDLHTKSLKFAVFDKDINGADQQIGVTHMTLRNARAEYRETVDKWCTLQGLDANGDLRVRIQYLDPEDVPVEEPAVEERGLAMPEEEEVIHVNLDIVEARGLRDADFAGESDPYVSLLWGGKQYKTDTVVNSTAPTFDPSRSTFELDYLPASDPDAITLRLYDEDLRGRDDYLGSADVPLVGLSDDKQDMWLPVVGRSGKHGEVRVRVSSVKDRGLPTAEVRNITFVIVEAKDIRIADAHTGKSDPYVALNWGGDVFTSSIKYDTVDPVWDETFTVQYYPAQDPPDFVFRLYDKDERGRDDCLGTVTVPIDDASPDSWYSIEGPGATGNCRIRFLNPDAEQQQQEPEMLERAVIEEEVADPSPGVLRMEIVKADISNEAPLEAYCEYEWRGEKQRTATAPVSNSPEWLQAFFQTYNPLSDETCVDLGLFNGAPGVADTRIGVAKVDLKELVMNQENSQYYNIISPDGSPAGRVLVRLEKQPEEELKSDGYPRLNPGNLSVTIIGASGLQGEDHFGKSDPYCVFDWRGETSRTVTLNNTHNPKWNHEVILPIDSNDVPTLEIRVFDEDLSITKDDYLGGVVIDLTEDMSDPVENWYHLTGAENSSGQLGVRLHKMDELAVETGDRGIDELEAQAPESVPYAVMKEGGSEVGSSHSRVEEPAQPQPADAKMIYEGENTRYYVQQQRPDDFTDAGAADEKTFTDQAEQPAEEVAQKNYEAAPQEEYQTFVPSQVAEPSYTEPQYQQMQPQQYPQQQQYAPQQPQYQPYQQQQTSQQQLQLQYQQQQQQQQYGQQQQPYGQQQQPYGQQQQPYQQQQQQPATPQQGLTVISTQTGLLTDKQDQFRTLSRQVSGTATKPCPTCNRPWPSTIQSPSQRGSRGPSANRSAAQQDGRRMSQMTPRGTPYGATGSQTGSQVGTRGVAIPGASAGGSRGQPGTMPVSSYNYSVQQQQMNDKGFWRKVNPFRACGC